MHDGQLAASVADAMFDIWKDVENETSVRVSGSSMYPMLQDGDTVYIQHSRRMPERGELIAFRKGSRIIIHRVLKHYSSSAGNVYICRGDHNRRIDSRVYESSIVGIVTAVQRRNGVKRPMTSIYQQWIGSMIVFGVVSSRVLPGKLRGSWFLRALERAVLEISMT